MKHADCDGDSTVTAADTLAVSQNYGLTHPKGEHHASAKTTGYPDLYFDTNGIVFTSGATVNIPIKLGSSAIPMSAIYGLAAQIKISGAAITDAPTLSYSISWIGNAANTIRFSKSVNTTRLDWAYTKTDHQNASGNGTIATLTVKLPITSSTQQMALYFDNVKMLDKNGAAITNFNVVDDTVALHPTGIAESAK